MSKLKGSVIITGANGGLGSAFVASFLKSSLATEHRGIYLVRDPATAHDLNKVLANSPSSHQHEVKALDLGSFESVRELTADINKRVADGAIEPIRALVLNAAYQHANNSTLTPTLTEDGFEENFQINYLANFLLVHSLLKSMDKKNGRIVMVSSWMHDPLDHYNDQGAFFTTKEFQTMYPTTEAVSKGIIYTDDGFKAGMRRYGMSKLLVVLFFYALQRRLDANAALSKISVVALDPGAMGGTGITRRAPLMMRSFVSWVLPVFQGAALAISPNGMIRSAKKSGGDLFQACFNEETWGKHPKALYLNGSETKETSAESKDEEKQDSLWNDCLKLAGVGAGDTILP